MPTRRKPKQNRARPARRIGVHTHVGKPLEIGFGFEALLYDELGLKSMAYIHSASSLDSWRRCMRTYFEAVAKVIRDTVTGDSQHKAELLRICLFGAERVRHTKSHAAVSFPSR